MSTDNDNRTPRKFDLHIRIELAIPERDQAGYRVWKMGGIAAAAIAAAADPDVQVGLVTYTDADAIAAGRLAR